jgi:hypothetical protein
VVGRALREHLPRALLQHPAAHARRADDGHPGGFLGQTFQDNTVYPWAQTMDNCEVYAALRAWLALVAERYAADPVGNAAQGGHASTYASSATDLLNGLRWMWQSGTPNASGDVDWWSVRADISGSTAVRETNALSAWYPDLVVHAFAGLWSVALDADADTNRKRLTRTQEILARARFYWKTRNYDLFPWPETFVAAGRLGVLDVASEGLSFVQRTLVRATPDFPQGYQFIYVNHLGWLETVTRLLRGDDPLAVLTE